MSDIKPRRTPRESLRGADPRPEATPTEPATATAAAVEADVTPAVETQAAANSPSGEDAWAAAAEAQAALGRGFEQIAVTVTEMARTGMAAASEAAVALLGARTFAEAVEINAGLARREVDAAINVSARLSEISLRTLSEASRPVLSRFGAAWSVVAVD